jgi:hypothetical protein
MNITAKPDDYISCRNEIPAFPEVQFGELEAPLEVAADY